MASNEGGSSNPKEGGARLGGVRADFVANLGKHLAELQSLFDALSADPGSARARDEFRRRLHALTTRARILKFGAMAGRLEAAEHSLERAALEGGIDADDVVVFDALFHDLPSLAWNEVGGNGASGAASDSEEPKLGVVSASTQPLAVLVLGPLSIVEALRDGETSPASSLEVEHETHLANALELTRAFAPDVLVLDGDMVGAQGLVETLSLDPLTDAVPTVVLGSWSSPDRAAPFLACGVARALAKPVSPAKLRRAVIEASSFARVPDVFAGLGTVTIDELANVLVEQVRSGIVDTARPESRRLTVDLGDGAEVLAAVWGAVARVREMLTIRSQGAIRFSNSGPMGAVPIAPWLEMRTGDGAERRATRRDPEQEVKLKLEGRRVLVIDDDPAVTWFLSGLFLSHGAVLAEAHDGQRGLELAYKFGPELVITDILMPKLDGFALCRALKRDVVLRDVPVILLSWKEDLLQRMRELGVGADGYLRKEATSSAILRTVHESLRPRSRIEARLARGGEVRGRLDGLTARTLLALVKKTQPNAWVNVRDASFLFELQLKQGRLRSAVRTAHDGTFLRGEEAIISLLGVISGRFQVVPSDDPVDGSLDADVDELVAPAIAEARAAQVLLRGARLPSVKLIALRRSRLMLESLPESARAVYRALDAGQSPSAVLQEHDVDAGSLEELLSDAAARGAVSRIEDVDGNDLLVPETQTRLRELKQPSRGSRPRREAPDASAPGTDVPATPLRQTVDVPLAVSDRETTDVGDLPTDELLAGFAPDELQELPPTEDLPRPVVEQEDDDRADEPPTSLAEAVMREVADATGSKAPPPIESLSMLDASELKPRSTSRSEALRMPSLPPDAIVPGIESLPPDPAAEGPSVPAVPSFPPIPQAPLVIRASSEEAELPGGAKSSEHASGDEGEDNGDDEDDDSDEDHDEDHDEDDGDEDHDEDDGDEDHDEDGDEDHDEDDGDEDDNDAGRETGQTEAEKGDAEAVPKKSLAVPVLAILFVCVAIVAGALYLAGRNRALPPTAPVASHEGPVGLAFPAPPIDTASDADHRPAMDGGKAPEDLSDSSYTSVEEDLAPSNARSLSDDEGELQIVTGEGDAAVTIDGVDEGKGAKIRKVLRSGSHTVMVVWHGQQVRERVRVKAGRMTRLTVEDVWEP